MKILHGFTILASVAVLSACTEKVDKTVDRFVDSKDLTELQAGIWIDPNGCDHWIIDDGIEGYLSTRLDRHGRPVCSGSAPPSTAIGGYHDGTTIGDPI